MTRVQRKAGAEVAGNLDEGSHWCSRSALPIYAC
jgi:hypothetical protein